jgi:hypothetical protein
MDVLLYRIHGLLQNWTVLCRVDKRELLNGFLREIKSAAKMVLWLPDIPMDGA